MVFNLTWDDVGEREYETGIDRGVLYVPDEGGLYTTGFAWNGLTKVTESPSGAEANRKYADNIEYLVMYSAEIFEATLEAYTYPDEFQQFDGMKVPTPGVTVGQQPRKPFGLSYRTLIGNDTQAEEHGYKIHLIYGCSAAPSQRDYQTINDSPDAVNLSWKLSTNPVKVTGMKPTSIIVIDSTTVDAEALAALELLLYGNGGTEPALPMPDDVIALFSDAITEVATVEPDFDAETGEITIPDVEGVIYRRADTGVVVGAGVITLDPGDSLIITAVPDVGFVFTAESDNDWTFTADEGGG